MNSTRDKFSVLPCSGLQKNESSSQTPPPPGPWLTT